MRPDPQLEAFVRKAGLASVGEAMTWTALAGGVSSDIWRLDVGGRTICIKRALARLKVADDWRAPVSRNLYEWRWLQEVRGFLPDAVPEPLAADAELGVFAMRFLPQAQYPLWKAALLAGRIDPALARAVGGRLGVIHAKTARRGDIAERFATDELFHALRLEPYLLVTAQRRPEVGPALTFLAERTAATHLALVHGDISPKNILAGPTGPVFLDAECAWCGDPAFDLAFCLNHLLLKALVVPRGREALALSFAALARAYLARVDWEPRGKLAARAASLLPALMLARVDGKSPVEYLTEGSQKDVVRRSAIALLRDPPTTLGAVAGAWRIALEDAS